MCVEGTNTQPRHGPKRGWRDVAASDLLATCIPEAQWYHLAQERRTGASVAVGSQKVSTNQECSSVSAAATFAVRMIYPDKRTTASPNSYHRLWRWAFQRSKCVYVCVCVCVLVCVCADTCNSGGSAVVSRMQATARYQKSHNITHTIM